MKLSNQGFSLIELMIAVVIIGIISAVAWPSYKSSVEKSHNAEAKNALLNLAALQTQFFTDNRRYTEKVTDLGQERFDDNDQLMQTANKTHKIILSSPTDDYAVDYRFKTEPVNPESNGGLRYSINSAGTKQHKIGADSSISWENGWD